LDTALLERSDVVRGIFTALLAKRHVFLLGPPGTAKSLTVTETTARIAGAKRFDVLMTKFTTPEEILGPVRISALKADRFERATDGYLPDCHLAFLDEVFKANSAILNALLRMLNEGTFRNGTVTHQAPLITCVGASNELPQGEDLSALYDRFLLRFYVPALTEDASFAKLLTMATPMPTASLTLTELAAAQADVANIGMPSATVEAIVKLRGELSLAGITASDRRWKQAMGILKAEAYLDGRSTVETSDICALANVLWDDPAARSKVAQAVVSFAMPSLAKALEVLDMASEQAKAVTTANAAPARYEAAAKFRTLVSEFEGVKRQAGTSARMTELTRRFDAMRKAVATAIAG
jgi:MoxR-like ATPase